MRLFIALELPAPVRAALAEARAGFLGHPVRWAEPASLHLTMQFLGETGEALLTPLLTALAGLDVPPLSLALAGLGAFPNLRQPRVIWVGVAGDSVTLNTLQAAVVAATVPLGFTLEERPFQAHLTLGRVQQSARPAALKALGEALANAAPLPPLAWVAGRPALFQSTLTPAGAVYTRLGPESG